MSAKSKLAWKETDNLYDMKKMSDPTMLAVMQVLKSVGAAVYFSNQELLAVMTFQGVQLSTKYGNAPESAIWYAVYGLILCSVIGDIDSGYKFGQLSLRLLENIIYQSWSPQTTHMVNAFICHWKVSCS